VEWVVIFPFYFTLPPEWVWEHPNKKFHPQRSMFWNILWIHPLYEIKPLCLLSVCPKLYLRPVPASRTPSWRGLFQSPSSRRVADSFLLPANRHLFPRFLLYLVFIINTLISPIFSKQKAPSK
jgi:hypothetical protein